MSDARKRTLEARELGELSIALSDRPVHVLMEQFFNVAVHRHMPLAVVNKFTKGKECLYSSAKSLLRESDWGGFLLQDYVTALQGAGYGDLCSIFENQQCNVARVTQEAYVQHCQEETACNKAAAEAYAQRCQEETARNKAVAEAYAQRCQEEIVCNKAADEAYKKSCQEEDVRYEQSCLKRRKEREESDLLFIRNQSSAREKAGASGLESISNYQESALSMRFQYDYRMLVKHFHSMAKLVLNNAAAVRQFTDSRRFPDAHSLFHVVYNVGFTTDEVKFVMNRAGFGGVVSILD